MSQQFYKIHGLGNDFLLLPCYAHQVFSPEYIRAIAHRTHGIGCDQVITLQSDASEPYIAFFNADGSAAGACGNGSRCVAGWWFAQHPTLQETVVHVYHPQQQTYTALPAQKMPAQQVLIAAGSVYQHHELNIAGVRAYFADIGNPHVIMRVDAPPAVSSKWQELAQRIQQDPALPHSANVGFVYANTSQSLQLLTYERGVGFTNACGTNACASAWVALQQGWVTEHTIDVQMAGGTLCITLPHNTQDMIWQQGDYTFVAQGLCYLYPLQMKSWFRK